MSSGKVGVQSTALGNPRRIFLMPGSYKYSIKSLRGLHHPVKEKYKFSTFSVLVESRKAPNQDQRRRDLDPRETAAAVRARAARRRRRRRRSWPGEPGGSGRRRRRARLRPS